MIIILFVAAFAALSVYITFSSDSIDHQCGVDTTYHNNNKKEKK